METLYILSVDPFLFVLLVSNQNILGRFIHDSNFVERQDSEFLQESGKYELPPVLPGTESYVVKRRLHLCLPICTIQRDPRYFEIPDFFEPDRFLGKK